MVRGPEYPGWRMSLNQSYTWKFHSVFGPNVLREELSSQMVRGPSNLRLTLVVEAKPPEGGLRPIPGWSTVPPIMRHLPLCSLVAPWMASVTSTSELADCRPGSERNMARPAGTRVTSRPTC